MDIFRHSSTAPGHLREQEMDPIRSPIPGPLTAACLASLPGLAARSTQPLNIPEIVLCLLADPKHPGVDITLARTSAMCATAPRRPPIQGEGEGGGLKHEC